MKKAIALMSILAISLSLTACKLNDKPNQSKTDTNIQMSSITPGKPSAPTNQQKVEDSEKKTEISNKILSMFDGGKDAFVKIVTDGNIAAKTENSENGIYVLTDKVSQRDAIVEILDKNSKIIADDFKNKGTDFSINYSIKYGYIEVYCSKSEANSIEDDISAIIANVAFGQRMLDNTQPWGVSITVNDAETGKAVKQFSVSEDVAFDFSASDWDAPSTPTSTPSEDNGNDDTQSKLPSKASPEEPSKNPMPSENGTPSNT